MLKTIKTIYTDYSDNEASVELPILQKEDVQIIFKRKDNKNYFDNVILFNNYYYFLYSTHVMKNHKKDFIDFSKEKDHIQHSLILDSENENINSTILIDCGEHYELYSTRRLNSDIDLDFYYKNNSVINSVINYDLYDHMSQDKYCIVSTCVNGLEKHFIHPKDGLFYIPAKISYMINNNEFSIDRTENVEYHRYDVSDIAIKNSIDTVSVSFEQYEFLEEKIQDSLNHINSNVNMINDNTIKDKDNYLEEISRLSQDLSPIINITEQWRQIMLSY